MKRCVRQFSWFGTLLITLGLPPGALAFSINTHELLNVKAAEQSFADRYLKEQLGFPEGLKTQFGARRASEWIRFGGTAEDQAFGLEPLGAAFRSRHHFHNPLLPWDQAGLNAPSLCSLGLPLLGKASVRWAQDPNQGLSGQAAWADARNSYHQALTLPTRAERDAAWAQTFQILGQQMHLIADLAAPAHTRNDPHCPSPDGFEAWASENSPLIQGLLAGPVVRPDPAIFSLGGPLTDPIAKVPIARLWDTDQYVKTNPDITLSPTIGLAEYSNANFFSDGTVFFSTDLLPFPKPTSVELGPPEPEPKTRELRRYFKKVRDGELIDHLAVPSALYDFLPKALQDEKKGLDDKVFQDYGEKLLPRAVGYSAALLDYFFRGSLQVERVYWENVFEPGGVFIDIQNQAAEEAEGVFELYAIYDKGAEGERREKFAALNGGASVLVGPNGRMTLQFDVPQDHRPTPDYLLVFRGRLGDVAGAVVGQVFMVPHVIVVQESYHADLVPDCRRKARADQFLPWPWIITYSLEQARWQCEWKPANHALSGRILTNSPSPIIERIEARWFGDQPGFAPLTIAERTYAGVWQREGTEPDPASFSIADPAFRDRSGLFLTIVLKGGEWIDTSLATFNGGSSHAKDLYVHNPESGDGVSYLVTSGRGVALVVDYNWYTEGLLQYPLFQATSISGRLSPTDTVTYRWVTSHMRLGEGVLVDSSTFSASVIDDVETFPSDEKWPSTADPAFQAAQQRFDAIEPLLDPQTHQGPFITWQAEVARVYQPMEREFLRAVMTTDPPPFTIPLSGTQR